MTKEQRLEWLSTHYITADDVKVMITGTDDECIERVNRKGSDAVLINALWENPSGERKAADELIRVTLLLQKAVMDSVGGSYMNKFDYWQEYCKEHKIVQ